MDTNISKNTKIYISVQPKDLELIADYSQIEQVLINLIKNAIEAICNKENGVIRLRGFSIKNTTIIEVEDNGEGIPSDIIEDIFVPFFTTKKEGSGIGLSISKQIMLNHKGTISVISDIEKGTVFGLKFGPETAKL